MTLTARDFSEGTPLHHFFAWNARRWRRDRRYALMRQPGRLTGTAAERLAAAVGNCDAAAHAAVFAAFEEPPSGPRRILVIRLSAFGDFVQSLGPFAAIRQHHRRDHVALLTTRPFAAFAGLLGLFDEVLIDERPALLAIGGWLTLRRLLCHGRYDRVYDLQTSQRSSAYSWLLWPRRPEWSGIARFCSHPHANPGRDGQHTQDKQAEQLLMAGIYPTPAPCLPPIERELPERIGGAAFALLVPGSSPRHPAKRWPARHFARLAQALVAQGVRPVVVGAPHERALGREIVAACPGALDLVGETDLASLAALARHCALTVGNDSGVCHLAAAAGAPVLALFSGQTEPARHAPRGPLVRVLAVADLNDLAPEAVIDEAAALLATSPALPAGACCRRLSSDASGGAASRGAGGGPG